jgi:hypothetical protein
MAESKDLPVTQGETFALTIQWETEEVVYVPIATMTQTAPLHITTTIAHGMPDGWKGAVTNSKGMTEINAEANAVKDKDRRVAKLVSPTEISFNSVDAAGFKPHTASSGILQYNAPENLTGYSARMAVKDKVGGTVLKTLTTENGGIVLDQTKKTITVVISAADTAALTWKSGVYDLEMVSPSAVVTKLYTGKIYVTKEVTT